MSMKHYITNLFANAKTEDLDEVISFVVNDLANLYENDYEGFLLWTVDNNIMWGSGIKKSIFDFALSAGVAEFEKRCA